MVRQKAIEIANERSVFAVPTVTLEEAKAHLDTLIEHLAPGEEILITDRGHPLAQVKKSERTSWPCKRSSTARLSAASALSSTISRR